METTRQTQSAEESLDLQEILNPKSRVSSIATFAHVLWLRRWLVIGIWLALGIHSAVFLAFYDIPRTYWATSYLRFPNVVGAEENLVHDMALGNASSIFTLIKSYNVISHTVRNKKLQFHMRTKNVFRRNVFEDIQYDDNAPYGRYTFLFQPNRNLEISFVPSGSSNKTIVFRGVVPENGAVTIPSMQFRINRKLLSLGGTARVEADFNSMQYEFLQLKSKLSVGSLDKEEAAKVNFAVTLEGGDRFMVADVLNDLINNFIIVYSGTSAGQDVVVISQKEKELEDARQREATAREALGRFYSSHPALIESQQNDTYAVMSAQTEKSQIEDRLDNLQQLQNRKPPSDASNRRKKTWIFDAAFLLNSYGVLQANSIQTRLQDIETKRRDLLADRMPPNHPRITALDADIVNLQPELEQILATIQRSWSLKLDDARAIVSQHLPRNTPIVADLEAKKMIMEKEGAAKAVEEAQSAYLKAKSSMGRDAFKVNVVDEARTPSYQPPSCLRRLAFSFAALLITFFPGLFWVILSQIFFARIYTRDDANRKLRVKVLGEVFSEEPMQPRDWKDPLDPTLLPYVENFRFLRSEIENYFSHSSKLIFMITSARPREGRSLFAANMAVSFARHGTRTLLVDADLRQGNLTRLFGTPRDTGLTDLLREPAQDRETQKDRILSSVVPTRERNLFFLPKGVYDLRPGEPINQSRMEEFFSMLHGEFDAVIVDTSPVLPVADALNLMRVIPNVVFLVRAGEISASNAVETVERMKARGVRVACIMNAMQESPFVRNHFLDYEDYYRAGTSVPAPVAPAPKAAVEEKRPTSYLSPGAVENLLR